MVVAVDNEDITTPPDTINNEEEFLSLHWKRRLYWLGQFLPANFHAVVARVFDVEPRTLPAKMVGLASLTSDGFVMCRCIDPNGISQPGAFVGSLRDLNSKFEEACNIAKLTIPERLEFQELLNDWLGSYKAGRRFSL